MPCDQQHAAKKKVAFVRIRPKFVMKPSLGVLGNRLLLTKWRARLERCNDFAEVFFDDTDGPFHDRHRQIGVRAVIRQIDEARLGGEVKLHADAMR